MQFGVVNQGLAAATTAAGGPNISLETIRLGMGLTAFNPAQTALTGAIVYTGSIDSVLPYDGDTAVVSFQIPATAGPFQFGEIGLYLSTGQLFARAVYLTLQEKLSDTVNGVGSAWSIQALIKLKNISAVLNYTITNVASIPVISGTGISGPDSIGSTVNAIIGLFRTPRTEGSDTPVMLIRNGAFLWEPQHYVYGGTFNADAGTTTTLVRDPIFGPSAEAQAVQGSPDYRYLLQDAVGHVVPVTSNSDGTATPQYACAWLVPGASLRLFHYSIFGEEILRSPTRVEVLPNGDNSKNLITSAWFQDQGANALPLMNGTADPGTNNTWSRRDHVHPTDSTRAPINSPEFTGVPLAPTPAFSSSGNEMINADWYRDHQSTSLPLVNGVASAGNGVFKFAQEAHVHPTDTSRAPVNGGTLTGIYKYDANSLGAQELGFRDVVIYSTPVAALTTALRGRMLHNIAAGNGGTGTVQCPSGLAAGSQFYIFNNASTTTDVISITAAPGVTITLLGETYTGTVKLVSRMVAWIWYESATQVRVSILGAPKIGTIHQFLSPTIDPGFLELNGSVLTRTTHPMLFAKYGTTYNTGGETGTQFRLPDLRANFLRAWDSSGLIDTGRVLGSFQADEFKLHGHPFLTATGNDNTDPDGGLAMDQNGTLDANPAYTGAVSTTVGQQIGGSGGTETRPRNTAVLTCVWAGS